MKFNIKNRAFSLTELMIVLVILAILFAAMAPALTKRHSLTDENINSVWYYVNQNEDGGDIYYDGQVPTWTSTAIVGIDPTIASTSDLRPVSKMVIRANASSSGTPQAQIQFRYGANNGAYTGAYYALGEYPHNSRYNQYITMALPKWNMGYNNTVAGIGTLTYHSSPRNSVVIGANAFSGVAEGASAGKHQAQESVAVGVNAAQYLNIKSNRNTVIGANAAKGEYVSGYTATITDSVVVGANALGNEASKSKYSVLVGADVGSLGFSDQYGKTSAEKDYSKNNTILGSIYFPAVTQNSTVLGYHTLESGYSLMNVTAAGYGACNAVKNTFGVSTCIGYGSASNVDILGFPQSFDEDGAEHIYIGGQPAGFGGRAALEVHNFSDTSSKGSLGGGTISNAPKHFVKPNLGPTVVLNSNLVVRGNVFFSYIAGDGNGNGEGDLFAHKFVVGSTGTKDEEHGRDDCCRTTLWGRRSWHKSRTCDPGEAIYNVFEGIGDFFASLWNTITTGEINWVDHFKESAKRPKQAPSNVGIGTVHSINCTKGKNYPDNVGACPNLKLSDARLKDISGENLDALKTILQIEPYHYTFKADKKALPQVGVIAQDLLKYSPNSVTKGDDGYYHIRWDEMFFATVNTIKSLDNQLKASANNIANIESDVINIEKGQDKIQKRIDKLNARLEKLEDN